MVVGDEYHQELKEDRDLDQTDRNAVDNASNVDPLDMC